MQLEQLARRPRFCFGTFEFDPRTAELRERDQVTSLQQQPAEILLALLERPGDLVTRDELVRRLWPHGTFVDFDRSLNKAVTKLREALRDSAENPQFIETLPRRGYRFKAAACVAGSGDDTLRLAAIAPSTITSAADPFSLTRANPAASPIGEKERQGSGKMSTILLVAAAVLLAISIAWYGFWRLGSGGKAETLQLTRLTDNRKTERVAIAPDGRYVVYAAQATGGLGLWIRQVLTRSGDVEIVPPEAVDLVGLTFSPDGNYVYFVRGNKDSSVVHSLFATPALGGPVRLLLRGIDSPVSFSPDGRQFVYTRGAPDPNTLELRTANADGSGGRLLAILHGAVPYHQSGPGWAPDGRTIAVSVMLRGKNVRWALEVVSVSDGTVHEIHSSPYKIGRPLWLPTGDGLLVALDDQNNHGQLYLMPFPSGKPQRLTNDLADYDNDRIDLTRDGKTAAIVAWDESGDIWLAPAADLAEPRPSVSSGVALLSIAARRDGKILATDLNNQLWIMNLDGSQRALFTDFHPANAPIVCGQSVMFLHSSIQGDSQGLVRADADGTNVRKLLAEDVRSAACASGGKFVYYDTQDSVPQIRKIPIEGGVPVDVAVLPRNTIAGQLALSPDGTRLACLYRESVDPAATVEKLAVIPTDGGSPPAKVFPMPAGVSTLRWSPDGKALQYIVCVFCAGTATNIWEQPLNGGEPRRLTDFTSGRIFDFDWSADNKNLLIIRGDLNGDVVLLRNFR